MKIDAAFCWESHPGKAMTCDCCNYSKQAVGFVELYPEGDGKEICFYLCEKNAQRMSDFERRVAPEEASKR